MLEQLADNAGFLAVLISLGSTVFVWITSRSRGNETRLDDVDAKLGKLDHRVTELEGEIKHLPTIEGQHQLQLSLSDMAGDVKVLAGSMEGMQRTVSRMEKVMLESDKHG